MAGVAAPERVKAAFLILKSAAEAGRKCPTNAEIARSIGASAPNAASEVVSTLEALGMISVIRGRMSRVVTIIASGLKTAGEINRPIKTFKRTPRADSFWTPAKDDTLMEAIAQGLDFEHAANWVGCDPEKCAARFDELAAKFGAQAA